MHINSLGTMDSVLQTGMSAGFVLVSLGSSPSLTNIGFWSPDPHAAIYRRPGGANTRVDTLRSSTSSKLMPTVSRNPESRHPKEGKHDLGACRLLSVDAHDKGTRKGPAHTGPCTPAGRRPSPEDTGDRVPVRPAQPQPSGLCCPGFRASITRRPRTWARARRRSAKWRAGAERREGRPVSAMGEARRLLRRRAGDTPPPFAQAPVSGVPSSAQAPSAARVPAFPEARWDTKGCRESAERGHGSAERTQAVSDLERIHGAGAGLAGTESLAPPYAPFPSLPFPGLTASRDASGAPGAGAERRTGRLHPLPRAMPRLGTSSSLGDAIARGAARASPFPNSLPLAVPLISKMVV